MSTELYENIFKNQAIAKAGTVTSKKIFVGDAGLDWLFSVEGIFQSAGAATLTLEVLTSFDGVNFVDTDADIIAGWAKATREILAVAPTFCNWIQIKATEADVAAVTGFYLSLLKGV